VPARPVVAALALSVIVLFYLGVLPTRAMEIAASSVGSLF
jgi:hypothetical protein